MSSPPRLALLAAGLMTLILSTFIPVCFVHKSKQRALRPKGAHVGALERFTIQNSLDSVMAGSPDDPPFMKFSLCQDNQKGSGLPCSVSQWANPSQQEQLLVANNVEVG